MEDDRASLSMASMDELESRSAVHFGSSFLKGEEGSPPLFPVSEDRLEDLYRVWFKTLTIIGYIIGKQKILIIIDRCLHRAYNDRYRFISGKSVEFLGCVTNTDSISVDQTVHD